MAYKRCYIKGNGEYLTSYKKLVKVSDMCQLVDYKQSGAVSTIAGVTFTNNNDGSFTVNGTSTAPYYSQFNMYQSIEGLKKDHIYLCLQNITTNDIQFICEYKYADDAGISNNKFIQYSQIRKFPGAPLVFNFALRVDKGKTVDVDIIPQLYDLTEMFGAGHEPATAAEFKALYPLSYYPYQPYCFAPVKSSNYIGKTKNLINIKSTNNSEIEVYSNNTICIMKGYSENLQVQGLVEVFKGLTPGKTYTISRKTAGTIENGVVSGRIALYTPSLSSPFKTLIDYSSDNDAQFSLTQEEIDATTAVYGWGNSNQDFYLCNIQLEEGDTATPFTMPDFV